MTPSDAAERLLQTAEGVTLRLRLAGRGTRLGALLLDLALQGLVLGALALALLGIARGLGGGKAAGGALQALFVLWLLASFVLRNAWFLGFELGPRGATPGKRMLGLRIATRDGSRLTADRVLARNLLREVELSAPLAVPGLLGTSGGAHGLGWSMAAGLAWLVLFAGLPLFNRDRLRPGDIVAGTWVVEAPHRRLAAALSVPQGPAGGPYRFSAAELAAYGEYELGVLEKVLREGAPAPMAAVAGAIAARIGWHPPADAEEIHAFLLAYYTQLRGRLEAGMQLGHRRASKHAPPR
ncbi:MAG TPA: RDD family protein [Novosphingobium sp.]|nr:RDD family protein [Novosphingobium sp.]